MNWFKNQISARLLMALCFVCISLMLLLMVPLVLVLPELGIKILEEFGIGHSGKR